MVNNCYICGTKLKTTSWDRKFCPNCGIIEEENKVQSDEDAYKGYIG